MTTQEGRVRDLVRAGTISDAEGRRLIEALRGRQAGRPFLLDPFDRLSTATGWTIAALVLAAHLVVAWMGVRFDGALDVHLAAAAPSWPVVLGDVLNAIGVTVVLLWAASLIAAKRGRFVDFLKTVIIARLPLPVIGALASALMPPVRETLARLAAGQPPTPQVMVTSIMMIPLMIWFFALLYFGFAHASGMRGRKAGVTFTLAILVAEITTTLVLLAVSKMS